MTPTVPNLTRAVWEREHSRGWKWAGHELAQSVPANHSPGFQDGVASWLIRQTGPHVHAAPGSAVEQWKRMGGDVK